MVRKLTVDRLAFVIVGLLVVSITWNGIRLGGGAIGDVFLLSGFVVAIPLVVSEKRRVPLPSWLLFTAGGLVCAALITMIFPPGLQLVHSTQLEQTMVANVPNLVFPVRSNLAPLIKWELAMIATPLLFALVSNTPRRCIRLLDLWVVSAGVSAFVALLDVAGLHLASEPIVQGRSSGLTIHANYLAFSSTFAIPAAMLWLGRGQRWTTAGIVAVAALVGGVYASGSRDAAVGVLIAIGATTLAIAPLRRRVIPTLPIIGMVLVVVLLYTSLGHTILQHMRLDSNNTSAISSDIQRNLLAHDAITQFTARPLSGVGFGILGDAHNIYLQLLASGGLIAAVSLLAYFAGLLVSSRHVLRTPLRDEALAAAVAIVVWMIVGYFDNQLIDKFIYIMPSVLFAIACLPQRTTEPVGVPKEEALLVPGRPATEPSADREPVPAL
ncbi:MAG: O-antigen ligase family protein [Solirubrobacteraceae bacterium]